MVHKYDGPKQLEPAHGQTGYLLLGMKVRSRQTALLALILPGSLDNVCATQRKENWGLVLSRSD